MKKKKISIIIPCFNAQDYIENCLNSIFEQTFKNFELICVNDGSSDNTLKLLQDYSRDKDNFKIIDKKNEGASKAILDGLKEANCDYVCIIDNDDILDSEYLSKMYNRIKEEKSDIVVCGFNRVDVKTGKILSKEMCNKRNNLINIPDDIGNLLEVNTALWNKLFKREIINNVFKLNFIPKNIGDLIIMEMAYLKTKKISFINEPLYNYQVHEGSIIKTVKKDAIEDTYRSLEEIRKIYSNEAKHMVEFIDTMAFLHLGISLMYRIYSSNDKNVKTILKENKKELNTNFPKWRKSRYIKFSYLIKNHFRNSKLFICKAFYKFNMFRFFLFMYNCITKILKIDIKW